MAITREAIEERLAQLRNGQEALTAQIAQLQANIHANEGAIQDCEYWLTQLDAEQPKE